MSSLGFRKRIYTADFVSMKSQNEEREKTRNPPIQVNDRKRSVCWQYLCGYGYASAGLQKSWRIWCSSPLCTDTASHQCVFARDSLTRTLASEKCYHSVSTQSGYSETITSNSSACHAHQEHWWVKFTLSFFTSSSFYLQSIRTPDNNLKILWFSFWRKCISIMLLLPFRRINYNYYNVDKYLFCLLRKSLMDST